MTVTMLRLDLSDIGGGGEAPALPGGKLHVVFPLAHFYLCCVGGHWEVMLGRTGAADTGTLEVLQLRKLSHRRLVRFLLPPSQSHVPRVLSLRFVICSQPELSWFHQKHIPAEELSSVLPCGVVPQLGCVSITMLTC